MPGKFSQTALKEGSRSPTTAFPPKKGRSSLGLEAPREAVLRFAGQPPISEYTEIESGRPHKNRPQLIAAMDECKRLHRKLVIAKLDRLSRDVEFISGLFKSKVDFVAADNPYANKLTVPHTLGTLRNKTPKALPRKAVRSMQRVQVRKSKRKFPFNSLLIGIEMPTYREAADSGFKTLMGLWDGEQPFYASNGGCFWMGGNTSQVALNYLIATGQPDNYKLADTALTLFNKKITDPNPENWVNDGTWLDDYGWWGNALTSACLNAKVLGYEASFQQILAQYAVNCWIGMKGGWDNSPLPNLPTISGGIWNNKDGSSYLAGRNCVTNEVYWLLSYFLSVTQNDQKYIDPNTDVAAWFSQAKTQGVLFDSGGLVLERFKGTEDSGYKTHNMEGYTWIGDQGCFCAAVFTSTRRMQVI